MRRYTRSEIGLRDPGRTRPLEESFGVFLHHTAGPRAGTVVEAFSILRDMQRRHMANRRQVDIGYSWLVDDEGNQYTGRGWGVVGGHTGGYNATSHGVAYIGNANDRIPTEMAFAAIIDLLDEHDQSYGPGFVRPHREVGRTDCPGQHIVRWLRAGRSLPHFSPIADYEEARRAAVAALDRTVESVRAATWHLSRLLREPDHSEVVCLQRLRQVQQHLAKAQDIDLPAKEIGHS